MNSRENAQYVRRWSVTCMNAEPGAGRQASPCVLCLAGSLVKRHGEPGNERRLRGRGAMALQTPRQGARQVKEAEGPHCTAIPSWLGLVLETPTGHNDMPQGNLTWMPCPPFFSMKKCKSEDCLQG